jgi:hypothetical protein
MAGNINSDDRHRDADLLGALLQFHVCPCRTENGEQRLVDFVLGALQPEAAAGIAAHVESCAACSAIVRELRLDQRAPIPIRMPTPPIWRRAAIAALLAVIGGTAAWRFVRHDAPLDRLNDGGMRLALNSGRWGGVTLPDSADRDLVLATLGTGHLPTALRDMPAAQSGVLRGDAPTAGFDLVSPVNQRLEPARPRFTWTALAGAVSYRVAVFSMNMEVLEESPSLSGSQTSWESTKDLPRGVRLGWQVTAERSGLDSVLSPAPPASSVYFEIVSAEAEQRLIRARAAAAPSHLLLASIYAQQGMRDEAAGEIAALANANPQSALARSLLVTSHR